MRRLSATILLAGLAAFAALPPFAGHWQCPDGTPCHYTGGATFECASPSSNAQQNLPHCCRKKKRQSPHCRRHGRLPLSVRVSFPQPSRLIASDDSCRCQFVPLNGSRLSAVQPTSASPTLAGGTPISFVDLPRFAPQGKFLSPENHSRVACAGPAPHIGRAPPVMA